MEYIWPTIFTFLAQSNPQKAEPRNGVIHEKASLGGLCIESTIKLFALVVSVWNRNTHYLPLKFHCLWH